MSDALNPRAKVGGNNPPPLDVQLKEKHKPIFDRTKAWLRKAKLAESTGLAPQTLEDCAKLEAIFAEGRDLANDADRVREKEKEPSLTEGKIIDGLFNGEIRDVVGADTKKPGLAQRLLQAAAQRRLAIGRAEQERMAADAEKARKEQERLAEVAERQEDKGQVRAADVTAAKADGAGRLADDLEARAEAPIAQATRAVIGGGRSVSVDAKLECTGVTRMELDLEALRPYFDQDALVKAVNNALKLKAFTALKGAAIIEKAVGRVR